jgi:uncharacterized OsmC-like protein
MSAGVESSPNVNRVTIQFRQQKQFDVRVRDHVMTCDQPPEDGGLDRGPAPAEWFNAGVGACIGFYVLSYLQARSLPTDGLEIGTTWETEKSPKRIGRIRTRVTLPPGVPEVNHPRILQAAQRCLIHNTLHQPPEVAIEVLDPTGESRAVAG